MWTIRFNSVEGSSPRHHPPPLGASSTFCTRLLWARLAGGKNSSIFLHKSDYPLHWGVKSHFRHYGMCGYSSLHHRRRDSIPHHSCGPPNGITFFSFCRWSMSDLNSRPWNLVVGDLIGYAIGTRKVYPSPFGTLVEIAFSTGYFPHFQHEQKIEKRKKKQE